jgi:nucleoid-associated protein YgaU
MALSTKVAFSTCVTFIFGMCWLVNSVARPLVEMPAPFVVRGPDKPGAVVPALATNRASRPARPAVVTVAGRFARPSPVKANANGEQPRADALVAAVALPHETEFEAPLFAPVCLPEAMLAASPDERHQEPAGDSQSPPAEVPIPAAIVADQPAPEIIVLGTSLDELERTEIESPSALALSGDRPADAVTEYKVQRGDTLVKIMRRLWNSDDPRLLKALLAANPKVAKRRDRIFVGEVLNIPAVDGTPEAPAIALAAGRDENPAQTLASASDNLPKCSWYTIRKHDSLTKIARRVLNDEHRWREIAKLNRLRNADRILPGRRIKLPPIETDT